MRQEEGRVLGGLRGSVEVAVQQRKNTSRRLEQLAVVVRRPDHATVHKVLAGELVGTYRGMQCGHQQRRGDALAADVSQCDAHPALRARLSLLRMWPVEQDKIVVITRNLTRQTANDIELNYTQVS